MVWRAVESHRVNLTLKNHFTPSLGKQKKISKPNDLKSMQQHVAGNGPIRLYKTLQTSSKFELKLRNRTKD